MPVFGEVTKSETFVQKNSYQSYQPELEGLARTGVIKERQKYASMHSMGDLLSVRLWHAV